MRVNEKNGKEVEKGSISMQPVINMKGNGCMIKNTGKEPYISRMETNIQEHLFREPLKEKGPINTTIRDFMRGNGRII